MNKRLVCTLADDDNLKYFESTTIPYQRVYATSVGADYLIFGSTDCYHKYKETKDLTFEFQWGIEQKHIKLKELLVSQYDQVLFLDADVLPLKAAPDIFELVGEESLGVYNEYCCPTKYRPIPDQQVYPVIKQYNEVRAKLGKSLVNPNDYKGMYFNNGVYCISKKHSHILEVPDTYILTKSWTQDWFNYCIQLHQPELKVLDRKWDSFICTYGNSYEIDTAYFIHCSYNSSDYKARAEKMQSLINQLKFKGLL